MASSSAPVATDDLAAIAATLQQANAPAPDYLADLATNLRVPVSDADDPALLQTLADELESEQKKAEPL